MSGAVASAINHTTRLNRRDGGAWVWRKRANKRRGRGRETMTWIRAITPYKCRPFDSRGQPGEVHTEIPDARTISARPVVLTKKGGSLSASRDRAPRLAPSP